MVPEDKEVPEGTVEMLQVGKTECRYVILGHRIRIEIIYKVRVTSISNTEKFMLYICVCFSGK